jgi:hypothetical protein
MTIQELRKRQAWPLEQKIDHSLATIETFVSHWGGGKTMLHIPLVWQRLHRPLSLSKAPIPKHSCRFCTDFLRVARNHSIL